MCVFPILDITLYGSKLKSEETQKTLLLSTIIFKKLASKKSLARDKKRKKVA
jgi:hypothetical protein